MKPLRPPPNPDATIIWESIVEEPAHTRCKHGTGTCERCGTSDRRDVIHTSRTPNKREARRLRRKGGA